MAEAILRRDLQQKYPDVEWMIESAGTWTQPGFPATPHGVKAMAEIGLDTSRHKSQVITAELLNRFQLILTMEHGHKEAIQIEFPQVTNRVYLLSEMSGEKLEIEDPVGGSFSEYQATVKEIENWLSSGLPRILELTYKSSN